MDGSELLLYIPLLKPYAPLCHYSLHSKKKIISHKLLCRGLKTLKFWRKQLAYEISVNFVNVKKQSVWFIILNFPSDIYSIFLKKCVEKSIQKIPGSLAIVNGRISWILCCFCVFIFLLALCFCRLFIFCRLYILFQVFYC